MADRPAVQAAVDAFAKELEAELALERARKAHHDARVKLADEGDRKDFTEYLMATNKMEDQERAVYETPDEEDEPEPEDEEEPEDGAETAPKDPTPPKTPAKKSTSNRRRR